MSDGPETRNVHGFRAILSVRRGGKRSKTNEVGDWKRAHLVGFATELVVPARMLSESATIGVSVPSPVPDLRQVRSAPNVLTMLRLFTVPFLVIEILDGHWVFAFVLLWMAGLSDGLDGLLARALKQRTTLGQFLDPIADKVLLSTLFLALTHVGII